MRLEGINYIGIYYKMMSDNESISSASSDEEVIMPKAVEIEKPKRKGRGKAKAKTTEEKVEEVVAAAVAPAPKAKRAKKVKVPDEPVIEEIPQHMGGEPVKKQRKSRAKSASVDVEPYTQVTKEGMEEFKTKSKAKKAPEPVPEPVAEELPVSVQRNGRKKREIGPEERERLLANLARGRETRKKNFELKRAEQAKLIEAAKVRISDPVIKEVHHHYKEAPATPVKKAAPRAAVKPAVQMPVFV